MKISCLISIVAAGRQARDTQLWFDEIMGEIMGDNNNNLQEETLFSETDNIHKQLQFYLKSSVLVHTKYSLLLTFKLGGHFDDCEIAKF